jgi:hypothetical protein
MENIINFSGLRNVEFVGYGNDVIKIIEGISPLPAGFTFVFEPFKSAWLNLADHFALQKGSLLSDDLRTLDARRDNAIVGIKGLCESYQKHYKPEKKDAAERIDAAIEKYGKSIHKQNLLAETETLRNLINDFETDILLKNAITLLDIADWVTELKDGNIAFNNMYLKRNEESLGKPEANMAELRKPAIELYRKLVKRLDSLDEVSPSPEVTKILGLMEELTLKYNQMISNRAKKTDKSEDPDKPEDGK